MSIRKPSIQPKASFDELRICHVFLEGIIVVRGLLDGRYDLNEINAKRLAIDIATIMEDLHAGSNGSLLACEINFRCLCEENPITSLILPITASYFDSATAVPKCLVTASGGSDLS